uniref:Cytochrome c-553 n=1 Tax=Chondria sp. (in: red algae) TaxID=1982705 RepID=A0A1Z1MDW2_9FLOR|nr:cytochrome c553 [Chondria sp. (in: red algae)]
MRLLKFFFLSLLFINAQIVFAQDIVIDLEAGESVFGANCTACHIGGGNTLVNEKNLKLDALKFNSKDTVEAIITQVTNGKNGMPAFSPKLEDDEIKNVANYVLNQAKNNNW